MKKTRIILSIVAMVFGAVTLLEGGKALVGIFSSTGPGGNYPLFIVGPNFLSGFIYSTIGFGFLSNQKWSVQAAIWLTLGIALLYAGFGIYILFGGPYESRTPFAMALRLGFWILFAYKAWRHFHPKTGVENA